MENGNESSVNSSSFLGSHPMGHNKWDTFESPFLRLFGQWCFPLC